MKNGEKIFTMALLTITQVTVFIIQMFFIKEPCSSLLLIPEIMLVFTLLYVKSTMEK